MRRQIALAAVAVLVLTSLAACSTNRSAEEQWDDNRITAKIEAELATDTDTSSWNIDVTTVDRVVTLTGVVEEPEAREEAERIARDMDGVLRVNNQVRVGEPLDVGERLDDMAIQAEIRGRLAEDDDTSALNIDVESKDGEVTLFGVVRSTQARDEAVRIAREVDDVKRVIDRLEVRPNG
ncbi:MAG TPA: BON domain-containing protein [Thermoanaerobaculia bacterium]|nr:BON domain-containing protein [Thermoanaerobaculia bacterium]